LTSLRAWFWVSWLLTSRYGVGMFEFLFDFAWMSC
jgi:hypothetical protein